MSKNIGTNSEIDQIRLAQQLSHPSSPDSGYEYLYLISGSASGGLYLKDSSGRQVGPFITGTPSASLVVPTSIAGCVLWYDADQESGAEGDPIGTFVDHSASANNATQATTGNKPLLRLNAANGRKAYQFDGVDDYLDVGVNVDIATTHTVLIVVSPLVNTGAYSTVIKYKQQGIYAPIASGWSWGLYRGGQINGGGTTPRPQVIGAWGASASDWYIINGKLRMKSANTTGFDANGATIIGRDSGGTQPFCGFLHELIMFNTQISSANLLALTQWLHYKWGIPDFA